MSIGRQGQPIVDLPLPDAQLDASEQCRLPGTGPPLSEYKLPEGKSPPV